MRSLLYKLQFTTPVHFGPPDSALSLDTSGLTFCADTLFSALCHTALALQGPAGLEPLCGWVRNNELLLSDGMPWHRDTFYLPKPMAQAQTTAELPAADRKALKKLQWLPVDALDRYTQSLSGGPVFVPQRYAPAFGQAARRKNKPAAFVLCWMGWDIPVWAAKFLPAMDVSPYRPNWTWTALIMRRPAGSMML